MYKFDNLLYISGMVEDKYVYFNNKWYIQLYFAPDGSGFPITVYKEILPKDILKEEKVRILDLNIVSTRSDIYITLKQ